MLKFYLSNRSNLVNHSPNKVTETYKVKGTISRPDSRGMLATVFVNDRHKKHCKTGVIGNKFDKILIPF